MLQLQDDYCHQDIGLVYCPTNVAGRGIDEDEFNRELLDECDCGEGEQCCSEVAKCKCLQWSGGHVNYNSDGTLSADLNNRPILECRSSCRCQSDLCRNRVVQKGPCQSLSVKLSSKKRKGLGLFTERDLAQGTFVCEYAGEIISKEEASSRSSKDVTSNYIMHVVENGTVTAVIDPTVVGNIGRYANHSCDPNMLLTPVRFDSSTPHVALFTNRDVQAGQELTFDYGLNDEDHAEVENRTICECGPDNCRKYLPFLRNIIDSS